jgi:predicted DsbA family dithiol-disulfide isomerase
MQPFTRRLLAAMLLFYVSLGVEAQIIKTTMKVDMNNPLLCDTVDGACVIPGMVEEDSNATQASMLKPIKIEYYTDPICSSCWGIEPQLRKLKLEYGDYFEIDYKMGGLLKDWTYNSGGISKPSDVAHHWDEVSKYYRMPIDGNVWLTDPLDSSYPPSIAFKAAQMQNEKSALVFLRKLREMVFIENKNITKWEFVQDAANYAGLDTLKLKSDIANAAKTAFQNDLLDSRKF